MRESSDSSDYKCYGVNINTLKKINSDKTLTCSAPVAVLVNKTLLELSTTICTIGSEFPLGTKNLNIVPKYEFVRLVFQTLSEIHPLPACNKNCTIIINVINATL